MDIGGGQGWTLDIPNWTPPMFYIGDTVKFSWPANERHNVFLFYSQAAFDNCVFGRVRGVQLRGLGGVTFTLRRQGFYYFACAVSGHCQVGQKIAIYANNGERG